MRWCVVLLCACNSILGLRSTQPFDAAYFDHPLDSPFSCPAAGNTPSFAPLGHRDIIKPCSMYTSSTSANRAAALCSDAMYPYVAVGPIDGPLAPAYGVDTPPGTSSDAIRRVWITPEGDVLILAEAVSSSLQWRRFQLQPDGSWAQIPDLGLQNIFGSLMSGVTRGPMPRLVWYAPNVATQQFQELGDDGSNTWQSVIGNYTHADLNVDTMTDPQLSADGLRLIFLGAAPGATSSQLFYTDRATLTDRFRAAEPLSGAPYTIDAFLDDDCARLFYTGGFATEIDYVQRT
jgi:hypothetical protein